MSNMLRGIRVLDLSRILAGPYAAMVLGDLGADIYKIERPYLGDETRRWGPPFLGSESLYFLSINRNKRSVAIDISKEKGQSIIRELASKSDVLLENYIPGKLKQFGLDYHSLSEVNPHLIYCSVTGFGQSGPYSKRPGYDSVVQGLGGMMNITGHPDGEPCKTAVALTDIVTGLYASISILSALRDTEVNGAKGKWIDCNLISSQLAALSHVAANFLNTGQAAKRYGTGHANIVPYQAFKTEDGYYVITAVSDENFEELCDALSIGEVKLDARFKTNKDRVLNRVELVELIQNRMITKSSREWELCLKTATFAHGPVNDFEAVFADQHVQHLDLLKTFIHPTEGEFKAIGSPVKFSDADGGDFNSEATSPPVLGQHTREVLTDLLQYSHSSVDNLTKERVIQAFENGKYF